MKTLQYSILILTFMLTGCTRLVMHDANDHNDRVNVAGSNQLFDKDFESFDTEEFVILLDPKYLGDINETNTTKYKSNIKVEMTDSKKRLLLRRAFYNANNKYNNTLNKQHLYQIQDRLIAASNQRCNLYKSYLKNLSVKQNSAFGVITTILAGAGSIFTHADTARALSGLASISSGVRAELNHAVFESVTTSIIIPGIDNGRKVLLSEIMKKRNKTSSKYTVEGAIADVIHYQGACNLDQGIAHAQKRIQTIDALEDVGITSLINVQNQLGISNLSSQNSNTYGTGTETFTSDNEETIISFQKLVDAAETAHKGEAKYLNAVRTLKINFPAEINASKILDTNLFELYKDYKINGDTLSKKAEKLNNLNIKKLEAQQFKLRIKQLKIKFQEILNTHTQTDHTTSGS